MAFAPAPATLAPFLGTPGFTWPERVVEEALDWVFGRAGLEYLARVGALHCSGVVSQDVVMEVCQDWAIRRFRRVVRCFDPARGRTFASFAVLCCSRYCKAHFRSRRRVWAEQMASLDEHATMRYVRSAGADPERQLILREASQDASRARRRVRAVVRELPEHERVLLVSRYWRGMASKNRAALLGLEAGTVRVRECRLRKRLRARSDIAASQMALRKCG